MDQQTLTQGEVGNGTDNKTDGGKSRVRRARGNTDTEQRQAGSPVPERGDEGTNGDGAGDGQAELHGQSDDVQDNVGGSSGTDTTGGTEGPKTELKSEAEPIRRGIVAVLSNEQKYLQANDLEGRYRLAQAFYRSGMVPKGYRDAAAVFAGMELACELGLKPFTALRNIAVINGTPSIWGDLPLALVRRAGLLETFEEFHLDKDYNEITWRNKNLHVEPYAAVCITRRKGSTRDKETVFTMDDAKRAGLLGKESPWKTYPRRMLQMRARSQNLKDSFGDVLAGLEIAEYDWNFIPSRDVTPGGRVTREGTVERDNAAELNKTLDAHRWKSWY